MAENNASCIALYLLGYTNVNKTDFILKYLNNQFNQFNVSTVGIDSFYKETILPNGEKVIIKLIYS